jgi:transposase
MSPTRDAGVGEYAGEGRPCELRTLVRIEDFRPAVLRQGVVQRLDAECRFHRAGVSTAPQWRRQQFHA